MEVHKDGNAHKEAIELAYSDDEANQAMTGGKLREGRTLSLAVLSAVTAAITVFVALFRSSKKRSAGTRAVTTAPAGA